jgi:hypothetical protein
VVFGTAVQSGADGADGAPLGSPPADSQRRYAQQSLRLRDGLHCVSWKTAWIYRTDFCGGGGVLDKNIEVGQLLVVDGAIRDEGFSYHYIEPSKYIYTDPCVTEKIAGYLEDHEISYLRGLTWTTDAMFRETKERIERRKEEGAKIVEMEQAGCIAVAKFRGFAYGALIYGGDDVSGDEWSGRSWRSRKGIRYDMVTLCKALVKII